MRRPQNANLKPFKKGQSGNPAGRPKGARNKLSEMLFADLCELHEERGLAAIKKVIADRPQDYLRAVIRLISKETHAEASPSSIKKMSDHELNETIKQLRQLQRGELPTDESKF